MKEISDPSVGFYDVIWPVVLFALIVGTAFSLKTFPVLLSIFICACFILSAWLLFYSFSSSENARKAGLALLKEKPSWWPKVILCLHIFGILTSFATGMWILGIIWILMIICLKIAKMVITNAADEEDEDGDDTEVAY